MHYWNEAQKMIHCGPTMTMGTSNADGSPRVTTIWSVFLTGEGKGFYFEKLPQKLRENLDRDGRFTLLVQNRGQLFWLKALFRGKFEVFPALVLTGTAGKRRTCAPDERARFDSRFGKLRWTKAYDILWKYMQIIRDLTIQKIEPVNLLSMTKHLLQLD